jgi:hypothetical protein
MGNEHGRAILQRQCAACRSDRICDRGQRISHRGDLQARRLKAWDNFGPARAVRSRSVYQHNVARRDRRGLLSVRRKSTERCCERAASIRNFIIDQTP